MKPGDHVPKKDKASAAAAGAGGSGAGLAKAAQSFTAVNQAIAKSNVAMRASAAAAVSCGVQPHSLWRIPTAAVS